MEVEAHVTGSPCDGSRIFQNNRLRDADRRRRKGKGFGFGLMLVSCRCGVLGIILSRSKPGRSLSGESRVQGLNAGQAKEQRPGITFKKSLN